MKLTQQRVDESLDNAIENGYMLDEWEAHEIANDLAEYDADFETMPPSTVVPFVEDWKRRRDAAGLVSTDDLTIDQMARRGVGGFKL